MQQAACARWYHFHLPAEEDAHLPPEEVQLAAWRGDETHSGLDIQGHHPCLRAIFRPAEEALLGWPTVAPHDYWRIAICELPQRQTDWA